MKKYTYLIPEKVDIELQKIDNHLKSQHIYGYSQDNLRQVISLICYQVHKNEDDWAHLKMEYVRKYVPHGELYLKFLNDLGIIECSDSYQVGVSSKTYRFSAPYNSKYLRYQVTSQKLKNRISKAHQSLKKSNSKKYSSQKYFLDRMKIDQEVYDYIETTYSEISSYNYALSSATRITDGQISYKVDNTAGRFHSNLTNMPKGLRQYVTINGVHLTSIDVKNCQPYLSTIILTNPAKVSEYAESADLKKLLLNLQVSMTEDVRRYIDLVINGIIYEYLLEEFQKRGLRYQTRDEVKVQVLKILFDINIHNSKARQVFSDLFPEVHRVFSLVRGKQNGSKFKSYQRFSILLQRMESHIILDVILKQINMEHPDIIAVTIHDSIMTSIYTDHVRIVHGIMEENFTRFVGFKPILKIE